MKTKYRDLTEKYRSFRLQPDALYLSRTIQTLLNKFTKKGKKSLARRHLLTAFSRFRYTLRRPNTFNALTRILRSLRLQFILVSRREGKKILDVPVPIRRNKRDTLNIQTLYSATTRRRERDLSERVEQELLALSVDRSQSATLRQRNAYMSKVYEERVNMEKRWK
jgi:ribosomal protein S7